MMGDGNMGSDAPNPEVDNEINSVEVPMTAFPDAKEGDIISLKVISVDEDSQSLSCVPMDEEQEEAAESGSDVAASKFDNLENDQ